MRISELQIRELRDDLASLIYEGGPYNRIRHADQLALRVIETLRKPEYRAALLALAEETD